MMPGPIADVRQISKLTYGFMASKALLAALNLEVFGHVSGGARTIAALSDAIRVPVHLLERLVAALVSTGELAPMVRNVGFAEIEDAVMIREITMMVTARKPEVA